MSKLGDFMKKTVKSWLEIEEADDFIIKVNKELSFEANAIKNRVWYRGDTNELDQMYRKLAENRSIDKLKFWAASSTKGQEIQKRHAGIPGMMIDVLTNIVLYDYNGVTFNAKGDTAAVKNSIKEQWEEVEKDNDLNKLLKKATAQTMYIGDGALKFSYDPEVSEYPIIEWWPGDKINVIRKRGRIREIVFKSNHYVDTRKYELHEIYGYGYIKYELYCGDKRAELSEIESLADLQTVTFGGAELVDGKPIKCGDYMWAVYMQFGESDMYEGRGRSIFTRKEDAFDSLDEALSQWMDALRSGRTKEYIPDVLIPRDPETGEVLRSNPFDNRFITTANNMSEGASNKIETESPSIQHESYLATYIAALDLCLQGIMSPSTLGIDTKKLDNAEAQREKEKMTLYTRQTLVDIITEAVTDLVDKTFKIIADINEEERVTIDCDISFGEYANPSFESQIETVGKGRTSGVMSVEASVEELYGDSKDEEWKKKEINRIKEEQGIETVKEPGTYEDIDDNEPDIPNE